MNRVDLKVVLLGAAGVGKSSLLERYVYDRFTEAGCHATVGAAFGRKHVLVAGNRKHHLMGIWDTAGSERYAGMTKMYYRAASAAILCYSLTDPESLDRCRRWANELRQCEPSCRLFLCGVKADLVAPLITAVESTLGKRQRQGTRPFSFLTPAELYGQKDNEYYASCNGTDNTSTISLNNLPLEQLNTSTECVVDQSYAKSRGDSGINLATESAVSLAIDLPVFGLHQNNSSGTLAVATTHTTNTTVLTSTPSSYNNTSSYRTIAVGTFASSLSPIKSSQRRRTCSCPSQPAWISTKTSPVKFIDTIYDSEEEEEKNDYYNSTTIAQYSTIQQSKYNKKLLPRSITAQMVEQIASEIEATNRFEISNRTGAGVAAMFQAIAEDWAQVANQNKKMDNTSTVRLSGKSHRTYGCC
ncbi:ras family-domain-containing protein [Syncephalis fuscata]|nr:ras family-domain-containing protein [Syncephalis fuscata]